MQTLVFNKETQTVVLYAVPYRKENEIIVTINDISRISFSSDSCMCLDRNNDYKLIVPLSRTNIIYT